MRSHQSLFASPSRGAGKAQTQNQENLYGTLFKSKNRAAVCKERPLSDDTITACIHGLPDAYLSLYITLERMANTIWNVDMTDSSSALVNTMAAMLANAGSFADKPFSRKLASDDTLDDLRCKLKKAHFSRHRPSYERPTLTNTACIVARNASETDLGLRHKNRPNRKRLRRRILRPDQRDLRHGVSVAGLP